MSLSNAYLAVRPLYEKTIVEGTEFSGSVVLASASIDIVGPQVPDSWGREIFGEWSNIIHPSGDILIAWMANRIGNEGLFAVFGPKIRLDEIAATEPRMMPAQEAWSRRAEPAVRSWLRYWPTWRCSGFERVYDVDENESVRAFDGFRRLCYEGQQIPDPSTNPLPWRFGADGSIVATDAEARFRVDAVTRPSINITLAGFDFNSILENEDSR